MKSLLSAAALLVLCACAGALPPLHADQASAVTASADEGVAPAPVTPNPATAEEDSCGMAGFAALLGQPASYIDRASLPPHARIITPETMVTQDYAPGRLNIHVSTSGRVSSLRCG